VTGEILHVDGGFHAIGAVDSGEAGAATAANGSSEQAVAADSG
jgi:hypothetical protein